MIRRYVFAIQEIDGHIYLWRFRSRVEREQWFASRQPTLNQPEFVPGNHSEVRRIYRRIGQGEAITFPVEID